MAEESDLERTEPASPRRLEQAREEGQVARSRELATFMLLAAGVGGLWAMAGSLSQHFAGLLRHSLSFDQASALNTHVMMARAGASGLETVRVMLPLLGLMALAALVAPMMLGGWLFSTKPLMPQFSRLNPLKGLGRMFSMQSLAELVKAIAKTILVGCVALWVLLRDRNQVFGLMGQAPDVALRHAVHLVGESCAFIVGSLLLIAALDVPFQLWQHYRRLRMTREELRNEYKETEGDPHVKAHIRQMQRQAARRRMMAAVPKADVIVTNPTHFAVALQYVDDTMRAPRVIAKGADLVAQRIRELGLEHGVPVLEAPPLARALYRHTDLNQEIPATLYNAVAEVLAWVYRLRRWRAEGGERPVEPDELAVPPEMATGAPGAEGGAA
ncbi:flagellar biosynthesis protein FlhB [Pandoraea thiooxydans]|uniref:Flagellar biosynthetic protein FlhB n=1 Tax=Pandoraea thiooxydans TaxID=445709 RepID=A0A0G3EUK0_9BURK|nr:flagellar biosynthesis protein FlhB [Pandoraea thiooxydans]AKJ69704.1 flagellar biosynthesis protein FlhB [Pandoraea thiooxydans]